MIRILYADSRAPEFFRPMSYLNVNVPKSESGGLMPSKLFTSKLPAGLGAECHLQESHCWVNR